jgi:hypothetical protein
MSWTVNEGCNEVVINIVEYFVMSMIRKRIKISFVISKLISHNPEDNHQSYMTPWEMTDNSPFLWEQLYPERRSRAKLVGKIY